MHFTFSKGLIKLSGKDVLDLLNRLSTNIVNPLEVNNYVNTVLLNEKGRIVDIVTILNFGNYFYLVTSGIYLHKVKDYLDKYIIMDDVIIDEIKSNVKVDWIKKDIASVNTEFNNEENLITYSDNLFFDKEVKIYLQETDFTESNTEYDKFRIERLIPVAPNEINEEINPLECGLKDLISFTKGCYIGQEVIARLDSQGKIPKQMKKFYSDEQINSGDKVFYTQEGSEDFKECGFVSSFIENTGLMFIRSVTLNNSNQYFINKNNNFIKIKITL